MELKESSNQRNGRPTLDAVALRRLAEAADGMRGENLTLVWRPVQGGGEGGAYALVKDADRTPGDEILVDVKTTKLRGHLGQPGSQGDMDSVKVSYGTKVDQELVGKYDAVFWSEAAVCKFVLEYYLPLSTKEEWDDFYALYMLQVEGSPHTVYGVAHEYPSMRAPLQDKSRVHVVLEDGIMSVTDYVNRFRNLLR